MKKNTVQLEREMVDILEGIMSRWFIVEREKTPDGSRDRIDLFLTNKLDNSIVFGVECKRLHEKKTGYKLGQHLLQAIKYSKQKFNGVYVPILVYPSISSNFIQIDKNLDSVKNNHTEYYPAFHTKLSGHHNLNPILGSFNVGELKEFTYLNTYDYPTSNKSPRLSVWMNNIPLWAADESGWYRDNYIKFFNKLNDE